jgi:DNA-binding ferritin-like protein (Dps family)
MNKIIREGLDSLKTIKQDKAEYKKHLARIKALPAQYSYVYNKIIEYLWGYYGGFDGKDMIIVSYDLLELFENGAAEGKNVLDITGSDVAAFSDELLRNVRSYLDDRRKKLNAKILKKLEELR